MLQPQPVRVAAALDDLDGERDVGVGAIDDAEGAAADFPFDEVIADRTRRRLLGHAGASEEEAIEHGFDG